MNELVNTAVASVLGGLCFVILLKLIDWAEVFVCWARHKLHKD